MKGVGVDQRAAVVFVREYEARKPSRDELEVNCRQHQATTHISHRYSFGRNFTADWEPRPKNTLSIFRNHPSGAPRRHRPHFSRETKTTPRPFGVNRLGPVSTSSAR